LRSDFAVGTVEGYEELEGFWLFVVRFIYLREREGVGEEAGRLTAESKARRGARAHDTEIKSQMFY